jgi:hypothetical protein
MKKQLLTLIFLLLGFTSRADVCDDITQAIREGSARKIATFINANIEINLQTKGKCNRAEAEAILKDFFSRNQPKSFVIIHQGTSKEGARYAIGTLVSEQGTSFRTYFFVKQNSGKSALQELRFEKE